MAIEAIKIRSALGNINVALGQIEGMWSGVCKDTPERRAEISETLRRSAAVLQEEAVLVERSSSTTIRECDDKGGIKFEGSVPFEYPPVNEHFVTTMAKDPPATREAADALAAMIPK